MYFPFRIYPLKAKPSMARTAAAHTGPSPPSFASAAAPAANADDMILT